MGCILEGKLIRLTDQLIVGADMSQEFIDPCIITTFKSNYVHTFCISLPNPRQKVMKFKILFSVNETKENFEHCNCVKVFSS